MFYTYFILTFFSEYFSIVSIRRGVEQLAARRAHNPEAVGSSPTPAIMTTQK